MGYLTMYREDGKLNFDSDFPTYYLHSKGTATTKASIGGPTLPSSIEIPIRSQYDLMFIAVRASFAVGKIGQRQVGNVWQEVYGCAGAVGQSVDWWAFAPADELVPSPVGLTTWNPLTQKVTYSSDFDSLRVVPNPGGSNYPAGRTYASIQSGFVVYKHYTDQYRRNGVPVVDPDAFDDDAQWSVLVDSKIEGAFWSGTTFGTTDISWNDVYESLNYGRTPILPPGKEWDVTADGFLIVDVTDL